MEINQITFELFKNVLYVLTTVGTVYLVALIKNKVGTENMKKIENELYSKVELARQAILFAEQQGVDLGIKGEEKFAIACDYLSKRLIEKGIQVNSDELEGLIKSTLRNIKDTFGEEWCKNTKE